VTLPEISEIDSRYERRQIHFLALTIALLALNEGDVNSGQKNGVTHADDLGRYYRIPPDSRDLNYDKYFVEGETAIAEFHDYTSHGAQRLNVSQMKQLLRGLPIVCSASVLKVVTIAGTDRSSRPRRRGMVGGGRRSGKSAVACSA
jgi:hypothetical protein